MTEQTILFILGCILYGIFTIGAIIALILSSDDDIINREMERRKHGPFHKKRNPKETFTNPNPAQHIYRDPSNDLRDYGDQFDK